MSHTSTFYDWIIGVQNTLKDMRVGYDHEMLMAKLAALYELVMTFVFDHRFWFIGGSLSVATVTLLAYVSYKWYKARDDVNYLNQKLFWKSANLSSLEFQYEGLMVALNDANETVDDYSELLEEMRSKLASKEAELEDLQENFEDLAERYDEVKAERDEITSERDSLEQKVDELEENLSDAEVDRDSFEEDRDNWEETANTMKDDLDEARSKVDTLEQMVDTYKELVSELETPEPLKLAA